jgi:hypothetical protein
MAIDVLDVSGCDLKTNIIRRQSTLGRHAKPSQRLLLELEYLRLAPGCIRQLRGRGANALADTLERDWQTGREQLSYHIYRATLGSGDFRAFWAMQPAPRAHVATTEGETLTGLARINGLVHRWLAGDYRAEGLAFELALGAVASGGGALRDFSRRGAWLAAADRLIEDLLARDPRCHARIYRPQIPLALAAANRYFPVEPGPQLTVTAGRADRLLSGITLLEEQLRAVLPGPYRTWRKSREQHHAELRAVLSGHPARLIQAARRCNLA